MLVNERERSPEITSQELREHIKYLASDELAGRKTGEEGNRKAARYIADEFKHYGLKPYGDGQSYFQEFGFISTAKVDDQNSLRLTIAGKEVPYAHDQDCTIYPLSGESSSRLNHNLNHNHNRFSYSSS